MNGHRRSVILYSKLLVSFPFLVCFVPRSDAKRRKAERSKKTRSVKHLGCSTLNRAERGGLAAKRGSARKGWLNA